MSTLTTPVQTLGAGQTSAQKFGNFGIANKRMIVPPSRLLGMIVGFPGKGKTSLFRDHAGALIINVDMSSTPYPKPESPPPACGFFPAMDERGGFTDPATGKVVTVDWATVMDLKKRLIEASVENKPRPETIVLDSLSASIRLAMEWVVKERGKTSWKEIDGRQGYEDAYASVVRLGIDLRAAGYGFYYIAHLVDKKIPIGPDLYSKEIELAMGDGLYSRLNPTLELLAAVEEKTVSYTRLDKVFIKELNTTVENPVEITEKKRFLTVNNEGLNRVIKHRVRLPGQVELGENTAWADFSKAYRDGAGF
jgi:hypothetical protein